MRNEPVQDIRSLIAALVAQIPATVALQAGSASYRWLLTHAVDDETGVRATVGGLPVHEQLDLPRDQISLTDADGRSLTTIDVTQIESVDPS